MWNDISLSTASLRPPGRADRQIPLAERSASTARLRGGEISRTAFRRRRHPMPPTERTAGLQQHEGHPGADHHAQAFRGRGSSLCLEPRPGRLRAGVRRHERMRVSRASWATTKEVERRGMWRSISTAKGAEHLRAWCRITAAANASCVSIRCPIDFPGSCWGIPGDSDPPYLVPRERGDRQYATRRVYSKFGSVAAPTAGHRFTPRLIGAMEARSSSSGGDAQAHVGQDFPAVKDEDA